MKELYFRKIPKTSYTNYISCQEALNTPDENGEMADWHSLVYWSSPKPNQEIPLYHNPLLDKEGIEYRKIQYSEDKVHIANFARAFADFVYLKRKNPLTLKILDTHCDAMIFDDYKQELYELVKKMQERDKEHSYKQFVRYSFFEWFKRDREFWDSHDIYVDPKDLELEIVNL